MTPEAQLASVRLQVSILADQVVSLVEVISRQAAADRDITSAREKLDILEGLMWKLHARQGRLKTLPH